MIFTPREIAILHDIDVNLVQGVAKRLLKRFDGGERPDFKTVFSL